MGCRMEPAAVYCVYCKGCIAFSFFFLQFTQLTAKKSYTHLPQKKLRNQTNFFAHDLHLPQDSFDGEKLRYEKNFLTTPILMQGQHRMGNVH